MSTEKGPDHSWQQFGSTLDADPEHLELLAAAGCRRRSPVSDRRRRAVGGVGRIVRRHSHRASHESVEGAVWEDVVEEDHRFGTEADGVAGLRLVCLHGLGDSACDQFRG